MKKIRKFVLLNIILIFLASCSTVKEGFTNPKKNNSDEFLVQKKSPLVMPPNYGELPSPTSKETLAAKIRGPVNSPRTPINGVAIILPLKT